MPTVVDALVVTLGLDPKQFTKGQKDAAASLLKTRQAAQRESAAIEKSMDKAGQSLERLARNALKLFAIFTAGRAVKDFVRDITGSDAALGRLAKSLETTPQALSALGGAVSRTGGSADAAVSSFRKLAGAYNEVKLTGNSATYDMLMRMQGATGKVIRFGRDTQQTLYDIADAAKAMAGTSGTSFTTHLLEQIGIDPGTISLLLQGSAKLKEAQDKVRRLGGIVSKQDTDNAQRFQTALRDIGTVSEGLGRTIWTNLSPAISEVIERVIRWYEANQQWIKTEIVDRVRQFGDYLRSLPWEEVGTGILKFIKGADDAAKAVGGWKTVAEVLFGLWIGSKFARVLANIGLMRASLLGLAATPGGLAAALAIAGGEAAAATVAEMPKVLAKEGPAGVDPATGGAREAPGASYGNEGWLRPYLRRGMNRIKRAFGGGKAGAEGIPYSAKSLKEGLGISDAQYSAYREGLTDIEGKSYTQVGGSGGRYSGRYQFGPNEIRETAMHLGEKPPSRSQFLSDPAMQERYMEKYTLEHHEFLMRKSAEYRALSPEKKLEILGYAHNQGAGGALGYLKSGRSGSDGFGTPGTAYFGPIRNRLSRIPKGAPAPKPSSSNGSPSAWNGIPNAASFAQDAISSQRVLAQSVANNYSRSDDRRSYSDTQIQNVNVYPATGTQSAIMAELKNAATGNNSFAAQADYGKA